MKYIDYMNFSFFQIRLFLSLAETLNYTKTAQECLTTQSNVSKNIKALENALGIQLFVRSTSSVVLTPAGKSLARDLDGYYQYIAKAIFEAAKIQEGLTEKLVIAVPGYIDITELIHPFLKIFMKQNPNVDVKLVKSEEEKEFEKLVLGEHDIAFGYFNLLKYQTPDEIDRMTVDRGEEFVYMLNTNPLARKDRLTLDDLRSQNFIVHESGSSIGDSVQQSCDEWGRREGWRPTFTCFIQENTDAFNNMLHDNDIHIACRFNVCRLRPNIVGRPLEGSVCELQMAWRKKGDGVAKDFRTQFMNFRHNRN